MTLRVIVIGTSGAGKTRLASRISERLGIPHVETDSLFHGPNWVQREEFLEDVRHLAESDEWVTEWQYREARPILLTRATLAVWLDYPVRLRMWQNVTRTIRRRVLRVELWNGNYEGPLRSILTNRDHIIRWGWRTRHKFNAIEADLKATRPDLKIVRLRSRKATDTWVGGLAP